MAVRDAEKYLHSAIDSILNQVDVELELIVVDNASRDGSRRILDEYLRRDRRVRVLSLEETNLSTALNLAVDYARAPLIARMDADDVSFPTRLFCQKEYLNRNPAVGVVGSQAVIIGPNWKRLSRLPVGPAAVRSALKISSPLIHPAAMMRKSLFRRVGGYRKAFDGAEDYDLWLRISRLSDLDNLNDTLFAYRVHQDQRSQKISYRQSLLAALAFIEHVRVEQGYSPLFGILSDVARWRSILFNDCPECVLNVRLLACARLADSASILRNTPRRLLLTALSRSAQTSDEDIKERLALAAARASAQTFSKGDIRACSTIVACSLMNIPFRFARQLRNMLIGRALHIVRTANAAFAASVCQLPLIRKARQLGDRSYA